MKSIFLWLLLAVISFAQVRTDASYPYSFAYSKHATVYVDTLTRKLDSIAFASTYSWTYSRTSGKRNSMFDTLFTSYWGASILAKDTLEVSTVGTFPAYSSTTIPPGFPVQFGPYTKNKTNLYIRRKSTTTSASVYYSIYVWGW